MRLQDIIFEVIEEVGEEEYAPLRGWLDLYQMRARAAMRERVDRAIGAHHVGPEALGRIRPRSVEEGAP